MPTAVHLSGKIETGNQLFKHILQTQTRRWLRPSLKTRRLAFCCSPCYT